MQPSRRQFLQLTAASLALLTTGRTSHLLANAYAANAAPPGRELLLLCDSDREVGTDHHVRVTDPGSIKILDVASNTVSAIPVPFFGHTVNQNPTRPEHVVSFEKWGKRGALVDIKDKKLLTMIPPAEGKTFFGHAAFSADGSKMVVTENNYAESEGALTFRDTSDMKVIQKYSSYGMVPHECRTPDNGKTIMVVNKGKDKSISNLSWIDWNSGKLLNQVEFRDSYNVQFGHCDLSYDNWVCVSGRSDEKKFSELVVFISPQGEVLPVKLPPKIAQKMKGEALSIAFLGHSGLVGVTITKANLVLLIDYKTQELVRTVTLGVPNGILPVLDGNDEEPSALVTSNKNRNVDIITVKKSQKPLVKLASSEFGGIGTHLVRLYL